MEYLIELESLVLSFADFSVQELDEEVLEGIDGSGPSMTASNRFFK